MLKKLHNKNGDTITLEIKSFLNIIENNNRKTITEAIILYTNIPLLFTVLSFQTNHKILLTIEKNNKRNYFLIYFQYIFYSTLLINPRINIFLK